MPIMKRFVECFDWDRAFVNCTHAKAEEYKQYLPSRVHYTKVVDKSFVKVAKISKTRA